MPSRPSKTSPSKSSQVLNTKRTGDILREARLAKKRSLQDVSRAINVRVSMLESIEEGRFFGLTDPLYLKGFIKAYARYLGMNENQVLPFFRREYDEQKEQQQLSQPLSPIEAPRSKISPGWAIVAVLSIAIVAILGYSYRQYVTVALAPELQISQPAENTTAVDGQVQVEGQTNPDSAVKLNGQPVQLDPDGKFSFTVGLAAGSNILRLEASNKLGKSTIVERTVIGPVRLSSQATIQPGDSDNDSGNSAPTPTPTAVDADEVRVEVVIGNSPAWIEVHGDNNSLFTGLLLPQSSQSFSASEAIKVRTGNAGSTRILLHGIDQGLMGQPDQVAEREFTSPE